MVRLGYRTYQSVQGITNFTIEEFSQVEVITMGPLNRGISQLESS